MKKNPKMRYEAIFISLLSILKAIKILKSFSLDNYKNSGFEFAVIPKGVSNLYVLRKNATLLVRPRAEESSLTKI